MDNASIAETRPIGDYTMGVGVTPLYECDACRRMFDLDEFSNNPHGDAAICNTCLTGAPEGADSDMASPVSPSHQSASQAGATEQPAAPGFCPSCGDKNGTSTICPACREAGEEPDPTHCQHLDSCDTSSCAACEPRWRGMAGHAMAEYLHDAPVEFLKLFAGLSDANKAETYLAIASFSGCAADEVKRFIQRSRARANALGMLS